MYVSMTMKYIFVALIGVCFFEKCVSAPSRAIKDIILIPSGYNHPSYNALPYPQIRGPFDFIGNWIQSSEWFPIEINVPDTFASIGNGIGTFATNVGSGWNTFTQNVGTGFQTFTQNVGGNFQNIAQNLSQRFPVLAVFVRPNGPTRYFIIVPTHNTDSATIKPLPVPVQMDSDILESFP